MTLTPPPAKREAAVSAPQMRQSNALHILNILRRLKTASRTQLATLTGLTIPTVHRLTAGLVTLGLVRPDDRPEPTSGSGLSGAFILSGWVETVSTQARKVRRCCSQSSMPSFA